MQFYGEGWTYLHNKHWQVLSFKPLQGGLKQSDITKRE